MLFAVFMFAIMDASMKRLTKSYGPFELSCLRCMSSLAFLAVPIAWTGSWKSLRPSNLPLHLMRAALGIGMLGTFVYAVRRLSMAETYSLFLCAPLLVTALSGPLLGERVPARRWVGIAVGRGGRCCRGRRLLRVECHHGTSSCAHELHRWHGRVVFAAGWSGLGDSGIPRVAARGFRRLGLAHNDRHQRSTGTIRDYYGLPPSATLRGRAVRVLRDFVGVCHRLGVLVGISKQHRGHRRYHRGRLRAIHYLG